MGREEIADDVARLCEHRRARRIHERAARAESLERGGQKLPLQLGQAGNVLRVLAPARFGAAPQRPQARAWGVDEHAVVGVGLLRPELAAVA